MTHELPTLIINATANGFSQILLTGGDDIEWNNTVLSGGILFDGFSAFTLPNGRTYLVQANIKRGTAGTRCFAIVDNTNNPLGTPSCGADDTGGHERITSAIVGGGQTIKVRMLSSTVNMVLGTNTSLIIRAL